MMKTGEGFNRSCQRSVKVYHPWSKWKASKCTTWRAAEGLHS